MTTPREQVLRTLIEVGLQNDATRESVCVAVDAHQLLSGVKLERSYWREQLAKQYPELLPRKSAEEEEFEEASQGKPMPLCIYHRGDALAYYRATDEERAAWNRYAQTCADQFNASPDLDSYDSTATHTGVNRDGKITSWSPSMYFPEWLAWRKAQ